jgi:hypothetical protein
MTSTCFRGCYLRGGGLRCLGWARCRAAETRCVWHWQPCSESSCNLRPCARTPRSSAPEASRTCTSSCSLRGLVARVASITSALAGRGPPPPLSPLVSHENQLLGGGAGVGVGGWRLRVAGKRVGGRVGVWVREREECAARPGGRVALWPALPMQAPLPPGLTRAGSPWARRRRRRSRCQTCRRHRPPAACRRACGWGGVWGRGGWGRVRRGSGAGRRGV